MKKINYTNKYFLINKGFSLAEIVVYIAIFAALSLAIINAYIVVASSFSETRTTRDLLESGNTAMERISREIRQATSIDISNSTLGSTPGVLQLASVDSSGTARISKVSVSNGVLNIYNNGTIIGSLIGQNISVTNLVFRRISTTKGEGVKVEMTLRDNRNKNQRTANFYDTVILRGGY